MNRRSFLKSATALGLSPLLPKSALAIPSGMTSAGYRTAERWVRAHQSCSLTMLQRHLQLDSIGAQALRSSLVSNGVLSAQANAYGIHTVTQPLFRGAFLNSVSGLKDGAQLLRKAANQLFSHDPDSESEPEKDKAPPSISSDEEQASRA